MRILAALLLAAGCARPPAPAPVAPPAPRAPAAPAPKAAAPVTLSIVGTADLHGAIDRLPIFAGYVANLRAARAADGGAVILVDGGDMFQGTLESNLNEGQAVIAAYNVIGYQAAAIGNHEFDFGPEGPKVVASAPGEDPRGALKKRAEEARFPLLTSNIQDKSTGKRIDWPHVLGSIMIEAAGVEVGIIGASTEATPVTTMPANFVGLEMLETATAVTQEAERLRARGAEVVLVTAHIGGRCKAIMDLSTCQPNQELFQLLEALPPGTVDAVVGGHTHSLVAHRIAGVPAVVSYSSGRSFGRIDLTVENGKVTGSTIVPTQDLCPLDSDGQPVPPSDCVGRSYEGRPVEPSPEVQAIVDGALAIARKRASESLGVTVKSTVTKVYDQESPLGNLFADLLLAGGRKLAPDARVAMTNGGGLRADWPAGTLTYGKLYRSNPFDNRFATVKLTGGDVKKLVAHNLRSSAGVLLFSGLTVHATCKDGAVAVELQWPSGKKITDGERITLITSDFLASGGDGAIGRLDLPPEAIAPSNVIIRDAMAETLKKRGGTVDPARLYDPAHPRLVYPGRRPVRCDAN
jgi:5'-nucleotidase